jgi:hypothetical protein
MASSIISNRISEILAPEVLQTAAADIESLQSGLGKQLVSLGTTDRRSLPHLSDTNEAFLLKALAYARSNPEFLPSYIDVDEFQKDVDVVMNLRPLRRSLRQFLQMMDDTSDLAGSEALMVALLFYAAVKAAAKAGVANAVTIAADMGTQFAAQSRPRKTTPPPAASPDAKD